MIDMKFFSFIQHALQFSVFAKFFVKSILHDSLGRWCPLLVEFPMKGFETNVES